MRNDLLYSIADILMFSKFKVIRNMGTRCRHFKLSDCAGFVRYIKLLTPPAPYIGETPPRDIIMTDVESSVLPKEGIKGCVIVRLHK